MNTEKERLQSNTHRYFCYRTLVAGLHKLVSHPEYLIIAVLLVAVLHIATVVYIYSLPAYLQGPVRFCFSFAFIAALPICIYAIGYVPASRTLYDNFVRIGLVNNAGEAPYLVERHIADGMVSYIFMVRGIPLQHWKDNLNQLQTALNMTVASITQGKDDFCSIIVKAVPPHTTLGNRIIWDNSYIDYGHPSVFVLGETITGEQVTFDIDRQPMALIGGSTGSGKTKLAISILYQAVKRNYNVTIIDFKGLDFQALERMDCRLETTPEGIVSMLHETMDLVQARLHTFSNKGVTNYSEFINKFPESGMKPHIVFVDECSMLVDYGTSKEAKAFSAEVVDLLAGIARVARAVGIHLIIATQRPDANSVPGPIKSNLDLRICGKADTMLSTIILGDGRAAELIPSDSQGRFVMRDGPEDIVFQGYYMDR